MDDDFNTGGAVGVLHELLTALNRYVDVTQLEGVGAGVQPIEVTFKKCTAILRDVSKILGLFWERPQEKKLGGDDALVTGLMKLLIDVRNNLRAEAKKIAAKDDPVKKALFEQTDVIRKRLGEIGVTLEDRPGGTGWRVG
jgi:cysteinyl-tRNA synthetase